MRTGRLTCAGSTRALCQRSSASFVFVLHEHDRELSREHDHEHGEHEHVTSRWDMPLVGLAQYGLSGDTRLRGR